MRDQLRGFSPPERSRVFNARSPPTPREKQWKLLKCAVSCALVLVVGLAAQEYHRLMQRAAGFEKSWNPLTESYGDFYENEKRASKQTLFALWHGASSTHDFLESPVGGAPTSPTLRELLTMPSRHPFKKPQEATRTKPGSAATGRAPQAAPLISRVGDVTLILNHWARDTLGRQLEAVLAASVLPRETWVCLFAVADGAREAAYRRTVAHFAPRFEAAASSSASSPQLGRRGSGGAAARLHVASSSFNFKFFGRFQLALQAPTAFVWVVDDDVRGRTSLLFAALLASQAK